MFFLNQYCILFNTFGSPRNGINLKGIPILIIASIAIIILFVIVENNNPKKNATAIKNMKDMAVELDLMITRYNNMLQLFQMRDQKLRNEIIQKNDMESMESYNTYVFSINESCKTIVEDVESAKEYIKNNKVASFGNIADKIDTELDHFNDYLDELVKIKPERKENIKDNQNIKENLSKNISMETDVLFAGCESMEDVERRYRALTKAFHPDMGYGDKEAFIKLQEEYEKKKKIIEHI